MCTIVERGGGNTVKIRYRQHEWTYFGPENRKRRCDCGQVERLHEHGNWVEIDIGSSAL